MLSELNILFPLIRLSETKLVENKDIISNVNITGYDLISKPTLSNAGGVVFYVKNNHRYNIRPDFTLSTPDVEALWIEIYADGQ